MSSDRRQERAFRQRDALFSLWRRALLTAIAVLCAASASAAALCPPDHIDEQVRVTYVYDGDTVFLANGRHLRLVGLDTPEMGRNGAPNEPYAVAARDRLRQLLFSHHERLNLRFGQQRRDHYGRMLAHAFLEDGSSVTASLLRAGLATTLVIPPNVWNARCYAAQERSARQAHRGLWSLAAYQPKDSATLASSTRGFRVVRGRVVHIGHSARALWLDLQGRFGVRIDRRDLSYFTNPPLESLQGRTIEVQGLVYERRRELRMQVRYPTALRVVDKRALPAGAHQ
ncbi:MAG TPA: thermonuclease family protein [Gammaproteobacteria bacterium]|nr:thermonuclease family protein [Gammaproteobacteria bacterium]